MSFSRSPDSFSREYWSSRLYQLSQLLSRDSQLSRMSFCSNLSLPIRLTWRILAALPSLMLMMTSTRLRSRRVTLGVISTLYLPRLLYWRVSSWVTRSRLRRSKVSPSARPMSFRPLVRSSVLMSLLPARVSLLIAGRSVTRDHEDVALPVDAHVLEEAGLVQRADRLGDAALVDGVAALDRQVGEDGTGADALQTVDADVADGECRRGRHQWRLPRWGWFRYRLRCRRWLAGRSCVCWSWARRCIGRCKIGRGTVRRDRISRLGPGGRRDRRHRGQGRAGGGWGVASSIRSRWVALPWAMAKGGSR